MKELQEILKQVADFGPKGLCLATVVRTEGSSYRRPGARMLIFPEGKTIGSISGGCLERDAIERAQSVRTEGRSVLLTYDTTSEEDIHFGVGLGCNGVVEILVEPLDGQNGVMEGLKFVEHVFNRRRSGVLATVFRCDDGMDWKLGDRFFLDEDGYTSGNLTCSGLINDALAVLQTGRSSTGSYETAGRTAQVFLEIIHAPTQLVVFGAGYDAGPLAQMAKNIGFSVGVVDCRSAYATQERFPSADIVLAGNPETVRERLRLDHLTTAVIMSHNYIMDQLWLKMLLPLDLCYLGLMGPKKRARKMIQELRDQGLELSAGQLKKLHNPVGLDIGAESPEQIALAILAEIQATMSGHGGGQLCEKTGTIHSPLSPISEQEMTSLNRLKQCETLVS